MASASRIKARMTRQTVRRYCAGTAVNSGVHWANSVAFQYRASETCSRSRTFCHFCSKAALLPNRRRVAGLKVEEHVTLKRVNRLQNFITGSCHE